MPRKYKYIYKDSKSPYWQARFSVKGRAYKKSTQIPHEGASKNAKIAEQIAIELKQQKEANKGKLKIYFLQDIILEHANKITKARSLETYTSYATAILEFFGNNTDIQDLTPKDITRFVEYLKIPTTIRNQKNVIRSPSTINRYLSTLSSIIKTAKYQGAIINDLFIQQQKQKEPDAIIRYLSQDEVDRLVDCADEHLKPIIRFAVLTGARKGNILTLDWKQIDLDNRIIIFHVKSDKQGGKVHTLPIYQELMDLLIELNPQSSGPVFTFRGKPVADIKKSFKSARTKAGIENFRFHDLRHTTASMLVQSGMQLSIVKEVLGHQDINTTLRYAHLNKEVIDTAMQGVFGRKNGRKN